MISDWKIIGSATEGSLLTLVKKSGISRVGNRDLKEEYDLVREFIIKHKIDLGIFTPHHGTNSKHLIENTKKDLEEQLFSNPRFNDGYQRSISLFKNLHGDLSFEDFKRECFKRKSKKSQDDNWA